jgi:hypothetical protein
VRTELRTLLFNNLECFFVLTPMFKR